MDKITWKCSFQSIISSNWRTLEEMCKNPETRSIVEEIMIETRSIGEKLGANFPISIEKRIKGADSWRVIRLQCYKILKQINKWNLMLLLLQFKNWKIN